MTFPMHIVDANDAVAHMSFKINGMQFVSKVHIPISEPGIVSLDMESGKYSFAVYFDTHSNLGIVSK